MMKKSILLSALFCMGIAMAAHAQSGTTGETPAPASANESAIPEKTLSKKELRKAINESVSASKYMVALKSLKDTTFVIELDPDPANIVKRNYNYLIVQDGRAYLQFTFSYNSRKTGAVGNGFSKLEGNITSFDVKTDKKGNFNVHMLVQGETDPWIHGVRGPVNLRFTLYKDSNIVAFSGWRSISCKGLLLPISTVDRFLQLHGGTGLRY